jgi:hypothetical protein
MALVNRETDLKKAKNKNKTKKYKNQKTFLFDSTRRKN